MNNLRTTIVLGLIKNAKCIRSMFHCSSKRATPRFHLIRKWSKKYKDFAEQKCRILIKFWSMYLKYPKSFLCNHLHTLLNKQFLHCKIRVKFYFILIFLYCMEMSVLYIEKPENQIVKFILFMLL